VNRLRQDVAEAVEAQSTGEASISLLATAIAATKHQQNVQT
jgi:hypothetical protein